MSASAEAATRPHAHDLSVHLQPRPLPATLLQALQHLIDNGTYKQIASSWGVQAGMIDKPVINGATS